MKHVNTAEFDALLNEGKTILVDFFATWCGPCKMFAPTFDEFAADHEEIECVKVDVDQCGELAKKYGIMSIPTIILIKGGEQQKKNVGTLDLEELEDFAS